MLGGKAAIIVQPRGELETQSALQLLGRAGPIDIRDADLENQSFENAAAAAETPIVTWVGKALAPLGVPDTTGIPKLP